MNWPVKQITLEQARKAYPDNIQGPLCPACGDKLGHDGPCVSAAMYGVKGQASYPPFYDLEDRKQHERRRLPERKPLQIKVLVYNAADELIRDHTKDFKKETTRKWLNNCLLWAVKNGYSVEISNG
jgi:hypothetical protein